MRQLVVTPNRMAREIDSLFNGFLNTSNFWADPSGDFVPRVDISEDKDRVVMEFEVPGMEKSDLKVSVKDRLLSVTGERKSKSEEQDKNYLRTEIRSGLFCRTFTLPETVDADKIKADYKNGILELTLAKREEAKPKEIEVKVS